jgi:hypothetical protein
MENIYGSSAFIRPDPLPESEQRREQKHPFFSAAIRGFGLPCAMREGEGCRQGQLRRSQLRAGFSIPRSPFPIPASVVRHV